MPDKRVSLQQSLFRNLASGPIVLGAVLSLVFLFTSERLHSIVAEELTGRAISSMNAALAGYLRPVEEVVDVTLQLGRSGRFEAAGSESLDATFGALLKAVRQISSIHLARPDGREYMLLREHGGAYFNRLSDSAEPGWVTTRRWTGAPEPGSTPVTERVPSAYDVRKRVWFGQALGALDARGDAGNAHERTVWSDPYEFFTTHEPGITASIAYVTPSGQREVLGFDILLRDILEFARQAELRNSGIVFVLLRGQKAGDAVVLAIPDVVADGGSGVRLPFPLPIAKLTGAPAALVQHLFSAGGDAANDGRAVRFAADGQHWWGAAARSSLSVDKEIWIAATIPEDEVLAGIPDFTLITLVAVLVTMLLMVLRARRLAQRYGEPIGELVSQTERIGRLNFSRELRIESPIEELQTLARSQDAMRRSLSALTEMNDRDAFARELRALASDRRRVVAGPWTLVLCDAPARTVGGMLPALEPAACRAGGAWQRMAGPDPEGAVLLWAITEMRGLRAAQQAAEFRATARALLTHPADGEAVLGAAREAVATAGAATAPVHAVGVFLDAARGRLRVLHAGAARVLAWRDGAPVWLRGEAGDADPAVEVDLEAVGGVLVLPEPLFDLLDAARRRITPAQFEARVAAASQDGPEALAEALRSALSAFAGGDTREADLSLCVIGATSGVARRGP